jgi:hypothetical protein
MHCTYYGIITISDINGPNGREFQNLKVFIVHPILMCFIIIFTKCSPLLIISEPYKYWLFYYKERSNTGQNFGKKNFIQF